MAARRTLPIVTARRVPAPPLAATLRRLERSMGSLATQCVQRMDERLPWFSEMPPDQRSWVGLVAQAGIASFIEWVRRPDDQPAITGEVFGAAPRELTRAITLHQTVELVRITIDTVEAEVEQLAAPGEAAELRQAILRYSREVAFAAAEVYAQTAEARGAWDARLEAVVIDSLVRGEGGDALAARAAALGWGNPESVCVLVGAARDAPHEELIEDVHRTARRLRFDALAGMHGDRLVIAIGADKPHAAARAVLPEFSAAPVVIGPLVPDLASAVASARAALSGFRAVAAWPTAPRPVHADELIGERALAGDEEARRRLVEDIYIPLGSAGGSVLETVTTYLEQAGSLEGTARLLFVHPNTVRYRLKRATDIVGYAATEPRDAFTLQLAVAYGRLEQALTRL
jgi:DNA-binding PucR family transcriptional regulator